MSRTVANNTLRALALALACLGALGGALPSAAGASTTVSPASASPTASTGGASAAAAVHPSTSMQGHSHHHRGTALPGEQIATWFGPGFYGQQTACGQKMTPVIVGVASRTLPCGTLVLISYKDHHLTVPVIDRGPYAHNGAMWDLTWGAASALSIEDTVRIKTKVIGHAANTPLLGVPAEAQPIAGAAVAPAS